MKVQVGLVLTFLGVWSLFSAFSALPAQHHLLNSSESTVSFNQMVSLPTGILLGWEVRNVEAVAYYSVERRALEGDFFSVGGRMILEGQSSSIHFKDEFKSDRSEKLWQYRLKLVYKDGEIKYSPIKTFMSKRSGLTYPNPAKDYSYFRMDELAQATPVNLNWYDFQGRLVRQEVLRYDGERVLNLRTFEPGTYYFTVQANQTFFQQKVIIE
ncbi:MAG: T9SS type A sorting domain-containing protein [Bacteroidota bacterium]